ncbi:MAG: ChaN family lipoprotein [Planctomycetota bacterium]|jgi:uncharacterized iron-regulated protein
MRRLAPFFLPILVCACASEKKNVEEEAEATTPPEVIVRPSDLPPGTIHRTSRTTPFMSMCEELAKADVVYIGETATNPSHHALELQVIRQLHARGRLHSIGIELLPRDRQKTLDDYTRGRIDESAMLTNVDWSGVSKIDFDLYRPIFAFAREHRIDLVALDVGREILETVQSGGREALTEAQRRSVPAEDSGSGAYKDETNEQAAHRLRDAFMADTLVRWMDAAPPEAQMVVLAANPHVANRSGIPDQVRARRGKSHMTLVLLDESAPKPDAFAQAHADFVFVPPAE